METAGLATGVLMAVGLRMPWGKLDCGCAHGGQVKIWVRRCPHTWVPGPGDLSVTQLSRTMASSCSGLHEELFEGS